MRRRRRPRAGRWLIFTLFLSPIVLPAVLVTNQSAADTYFEAYGSENKNFGSAPELRMDQWGGRQIFLRFPLNNLSAAQRVLRSVVRLYVTDVGYNEQGELPELKTCVGLFDVVAPWTEEQLTFRSPDGKAPWNQGPGLVGPGYTDVAPLRPPDFGVALREPAIALDPSRVQKGGWLELDVTPILRKKLAGGAGELNLLLRSSTLGRNYTFCSRESSDTTRRPQLLVEVAEHLGDFRLETADVQVWRPKDAITVRVSSSLGAGHAKEHWTLDGKPAGSRVSVTDLRADAKQVRFNPDIPGEYRIRLERRTADGTEVSSESVALLLPAIRPHPRLYVTPDSLEGLRTASRTNARLTRAFLDWTRRGMQGVSQGKFHDMGMHEGCENTALAWLITGERQYLSNSIAYANQVLTRPMREHFKDVHAATFLGAAWVHAMALHYDWCHDQLTAEHRARVVAWLKEAAGWAWVRSGAPIAHNDGGARQCLLGSAALALLGDDPEAPELFRRSHDNFTRNLLPWLNDGGQGGRSGDGGEYEGLHGFYIVRYAWMSHTATGEDVFSESPYFFNRLKHLLFGWYPRPLVDRNGAFSMRQYYSPSGDHTRLGYVGDTQPYQSAAALCARYRNTAEAQAVRWLAGDWPTQWMQYTLRWAVLGGFESIPAVPPHEMAYLDRGCNTVYARSDWTDDATWILFENAPYVSAHGSLDSGTFEIFKGDLLAARTGNMDHANVGAKHSMNYLHRTIAANCLLIDDPEEKWKGFLGGAEGGNDGGGQRTNFPLGSSPDAATYLHYRDVFLRGRITAFSQSSEQVYAVADLTPAYNNPAQHGGKLNRPKVTHVGRELLYLRELDSLVVMDRITSVQPEFQKTWLLHSLGDLEVLDGRMTKIDDGEFHYAGATRTVIRYGWPKPVPSFGRCLSVTLEPSNAIARKIGGRLPLPEGQVEGFPGDQWHGKHQHRHLKDFWVNGTNYPPGNPPETRWFGEPGSTYYVAGTPDETGGRGKWRLEVSPATPALDDVFLHVLCPRLGSEGSFPQIQRVAASSGYVAGSLSEGDKRVVFFFNKTQRKGDYFEQGLPSGFIGTCYVQGMLAGDYEVNVNGKSAGVASVGADGLLVVKNASGRVRLLRS